MGYGDFADFIKYSWLFQCFDSSRSGSINDVNFWRGIRDDISPIPLNKVDKTIAAEAGDWIAGNAGMSLNIKEFFIWFRY